MYAHALHFSNKFGNEGRWPAHDTTYGINAVHAFTTFPCNLPYEVLNGCNPNLPRSSEMLVGVMWGLFWNVLWHTGVCVAPPLCGIRILVMSTSHRSGLAPKTSRLIQKAYFHRRVLYVVYHSKSCHCVHIHVPLNVFMYVQLLWYYAEKNISIYLLTVVRLFIHRSFYNVAVLLKDHFNKDLFFFVSVMWFWTLWEYVYFISLS